MSKKIAKSVDIVTSALNEELCIDEFISRIHLVFEQESNYTYRITIIDNGSNDKTWDLIRNWAKKSKRVRGIKLSRTFSFDSALTCGLDNADSDYLIIMASDLQDPPEVIPNLLREIEKGFDQVVVKIARRSQVPLFRRIFSRIFYSINYWASSGLIPKNVSDFRIMNRKVYGTVKALRESHRFMRGLMAWAGFQASAISIERPDRFAGKSKWLGMSFFTILSTAVRGIFAFSVKPLSIVSFFSLFLGTVSLISLVPIVVIILTKGVYFGGFGSLIGFAILSFGIIMISLGTLSLYVSLIYEESKHRPIYIVDEII